MEKEEDAARLPSHHHSHQCCVHAMSMEHLREHLLAKQRKDAPEPFSSERDGSISTSEERTSDREKRVQGQEENEKEAADEGPEFGTMEEEPEIRRVGADQDSYISLENKVERLKKQLSSFWLLPSVADMLGDATQELTRSFIADWKHWGHVPVSCLAVASIAQSRKYVAVCMESGSGIDQTYSALKCIAGWISSHEDGSFTKTIADKVGDALLNHYCKEVFHCSRRTCTGEIHFVCSLRDNFSYELDLIESNQKELLKLQFSSPECRRQLAEVYPRSCTQRDLANFATDPQSYSEDISIIWAQAADLIEGGWHHIAPDNAVAAIFSAVSIRFNRPVVLLRMRESLSKLNRSNNNKSAAEILSELSHNFPFLKVDVSYHPSSLSEFQEQGPAIVVLQPWYGKYPPKEYVILQPAEARSAEGKEMPNFFGKWLKQHPHAESQRKRGLIAALPPEER